MCRHSTLFVCLAILATNAFAGTTTLDFNASVGNLTDSFSGAGIFSFNNGRATFSGTNITLMETGNTRVVATGTTSITMGIRPATDATSSVGIVLVNPLDPGEQVTALVESNGDVTLESFATFDSDTTDFPFPNAGNNEMTLTYNAANGNVSLTIAESSGSASLSAAFLGGGNVWIGVIALGPASFESFVATGPAIPEFNGTSSETVVEFDLSEAEEVPATGSIATGCGVATLNAAETQLTLEVEHGVFDVEDAHIHLGAVGVDGGIVFPFTNPASPISQTFNVTPAQAADFLAGSYYVNIHTPSFPGGEIRGQMVDESGACDVVVDPGPIDTDGDGVVDANDAFPNNPAGATDLDSDGIGDEWEESYFGGLGVANATSDFDNDDVSDVDEFLFQGIGLDPTDGISSLPLGTATLLGAAGALASLALRRRKR